MLAKVKAQKTRLSKYLTDELGANCKKSQTTESEYYQLGPYFIRMSDHIGKYEEGRIEILIPFNDSNTFIIQNNSTISVLKSLKEVKQFLQSLLFVSQMCLNTITTNSDELKEQIEKLTLRNKELEIMVSTRNDAIRELAVRATVAENKFNLNSNCVIHRGKVYPLALFPIPFVNKIKNVIANDTNIKSVEW